MWRRHPLLRLAGLGLLTCVLLATLPSGDTLPTAARDVMTTPSRAGWTTQGVNILTPDGKPFIIAGVSWYGLETPQHVLYGLDMQDYQNILNQAKTYQFN